MKATTLDGLGDEHILTPADLAPILKVSPAYASDLLSKATIPGAFRLGRLLRICVKDVRAWIERERLPRNSNVHDLRLSTRRRGAA